MANLGAKIEERELWFQLAESVVHKIILLLREADVYSLVNQSAELLFLSLVICPTAV